MTGPGADAAVAPRCRAWSAVRTWPVRLGKLCTGDCAGRESSLGRAVRARSERGGAPARAAQGGRRPRRAPTVFLAGCSVGSWWFFSKGKPKSRRRPTCAPAGTRPRQRCASPRSRWRRPRCRSRNRAGPHRRSARARPDSATRPVRCRRVSPIAIGTGREVRPRRPRRIGSPHRLGEDLCASVGRANAMRNAAATALPAPEPHNLRHVLAARATTPTSTNDPGSARTGILGQLALKRSAMHAELARGLRDVAVAVGEHAVQMFPFDAGQRRRIDRQVARP